MDAFDTAEFEEYPSEAAWLAARRQGIGSSDAPALIGASKHRTPYEVFCEKIGLELPPPDPRNQELMAWGRELEEPIFRRFQARVPAYRLYKPTPHHNYVSKVEPWRRATIDGFALTAGHEEPGPVEIKWAPYLDPDDALLPGYQVQLQHQMGVLGAAWGVLVVFARSELVWFEQERHQGFLEALWGLEERFWRKVQRREPPELDGLPGTLAAILARFPAPTPGFVKPLPEEALRWDAERQHALIETRRWQRVADDQKARLMAAIGDAAAGVLPDGTSYTWRLQTRAGYTVAPSEHRDLRRRKGPLDLSALLETLQPNQEELSDAAETAAAT